MPFWVAAGRRVRKVVKNRYVPLLALGAAYCFLVMMFNVPIPDGTTAHAVGGVLVAVLLGPWAAVIAVSIALLIQALFFGDGGVLALGANCFNMAIVMPFVGLRRLPAARPPDLADIDAATARRRHRRLHRHQRRRPVRRDRVRDPARRSSTRPARTARRSRSTPRSTSSQSIPAMLFAHLLVAGVVDFVLTAGVIAYLQRANLPILRINHGAVPETEAELPPPRKLGLRGALIGLAAHGGPRAARAARHRHRLRRGQARRPRPAEVRPRRRAHGPLASTRTGGATPCSPATTSSNGGHPTVGYYASAVVGSLVIAAVIVGLFKLVHGVQRSAGCRQARTRTWTPTSSHRTRA